VKRGLIIGGVISVLLIIGLIVLISVTNSWALARDISIVILAIFQVFSVLLLIALLAALIYAVFAIRDLANNTVVPKVSQTLDQVKDTAAATKNTTAYVAEGVVTPLIKISSVAAGVRAAAVALARRNKPSGYEPE
jgi:dolichyl-phosphate-mannose--protein O-mannosyl transferase